MGMTTMTMESLKYIKKSAVLSKYHKKYEDSIKSKLSKTHTKKQGDDMLLNERYNVLTLPEDQKDGTEHIKIAVVDDLLTRRKVATETTYKVPKHKGPVFPKPVMAEIELDDSYDPLVRDQQYNKIHKGEVYQAIDNKSGRMQLVKITQKKDKIKNSKTKITEPEVVGSHVVEPTSNTYIHNKRVYQPENKYIHA